MTKSEKTAVYISQLIAHIEARFIGNYVNNEQLINDLTHELRLLDIDSAFVECFISLSKTIDNELNNKDQDNV